MKSFLLIVVLSFALPASGQHYAAERNRPDTQCKGVIHGVVLGQGGKPWSGINLILEPAGDYDFVFPETKTNQKGEYRFEQVCPGKWGVFVRNKEAGYPQSGRQWNRFLYGGWSPHVLITDANLDAQLNVNVPPKPGILIVRAVDSKTKAEITSVEVELKVGRIRDATFPCQGSETSLCESDPALVPPNQDVKLHVRSKGFYEWKESAGSGKLIRVSAGQVMALDVELDPIRN